MICRPDPYDFFKEELVDKIKATYEKSVTSSNYTTFLKHFGSFKIVKLDKEVVPQDQILFEEMKSLRELILSMSMHRPQIKNDSESEVSDARLLCLGEATPEQTEGALESIRSLGFTVKGPLKTRNRHVHFSIDAKSIHDRRKILTAAREHVPAVRWLPQHP